MDLLEANSHAMQSTIHTEEGGSFGSGRWCVALARIVSRGGRGDGGDAGWLRLSFAP